jgi:hypothetical protein
MDAQKDSNGRFLPGHKFGKGRIVGSHNKRTLAEKRLAEEEEGTTAIAIHSRSVLDSIVSDLGGEGALSTAEMILARRCAWLTTMCESLERKPAPLEPAEVSSYVLMTGHLARTLKALGLKRQPRDITPSLKDYLAAARQPENPDDLDAAQRSPLSGLD